LGGVGVRFLTGILAPKQPDHTWLCTCCNSGAESHEELIKGSKDVASLLVCNRKKFFWLGL